MRITSKYLYILIPVFLFLNGSEIKAQYAFKDAFPNMPTFSLPVAIINPDDSTNRIFVAQLKGIIYVFKNSDTASTRKVFINISSKVNQTGAEEGLLGLAFHPDFRNNRYFYVHYVFDSTGSPSSRWIRISRFTVSEVNPDSALFSSELKLFTIPLPDRGHNGGQVAFGPDKYLYISLGDGYAGGDISQDRTQFLGKILRVNVDSAGAGRNYSIPATNAFYGNTFGWKEEIYAYGFRNPWRFNFDKVTGKMWMGDVGQYRYEEINIVENGKNYGWNKMEGMHCYPDTTNCDTTGRGFVRPVWEYNHDNVLLPYSVLGGYVYRGTQFPELYGKYIYGDYAQGTIWSLEYDGINPAVNSQLLDTNFNFSTFGVDLKNELYVCRISTLNGRIYRLYNPDKITLNLKVIIEGYYNVSANTLSKRDSISVYLHSSESPFALIDSATTVIDTITFSGICFFKYAPDGNYFLRVKHKTILEAWSEIGGINLVRGNFSSYDFTDDTIKTFGGGTKLKGTKYCLISGDCNQDGVINAIDRAAVIFNLGSKGNEYEDLDGNGVVNAADRSIVVSNLGRSKKTP
ncbi:MAG TPA: PQQ-dependent sugar dehydrogenase [Ignavibacteria bacterium]|nr:PQQ-dependent sugar dehydrogenase [Ignavibacteria bacterium]